MHEFIIPSSPPPICITHYYCKLLRDFCAMYDLPPTLPVEAIHHTILIMTTRPWRFARIGLTRVNPSPHHLQGGWVVAG